MKQRTTTRQITEAVTSSLLTITKAERRCKLSSQIEKINMEEFTEYIQFLNESGVFADFIGWHFEKYKKLEKEYIVESGRMNPDADFIIIVHLRVNNGVSVEDVNEMLVMEESED